MEKFVAKYMQSLILFMASIGFYLGSVYGYKETILHMIDFLIFMEISKLILVMFKDADAPIMMRYALAAVGFFSTRVIFTSLESFELTRKSIENKGILIEIAEVTRIPQNTIVVTNEKEGKALLRMMDSLEDHDDVQKAYSNFDISEEMLESLLN